MKLIQFAISIATFALMVGLLIYGLMLLSDAIDGINAAIESGLLPKCVRDAIVGLTLVISCATVAMLFAVQRKPDNIKKCEEEIFK